MPPHISYFMHSTHRLFHLLVLVSCLLSVHIEGRWARLTPAKRAINNRVRSIANTIKIMDKLIDFVGKQLVSTLCLPKNVVKAITIMGAQIHEDSSRYYKQVV